VTFEQQAKLFREKQDKLISKYEIVFGLVFARQLRKFSKAINDFPTGAIYEIDIYFDEKPLAKAYETMVKETANKFQIKDPSILTKSITADVWRSLVNSYLSGIGGERITEINKFTKEYVLKRLRPILAEGVNQGLGIAQIGRSIVSDISEYSGKFAKYRSERIARTEIVGTSNWASVTSVESSGVKDRLLKKWLVTEDGRERETHQEMMDHPLIAIDDFFEVRNVKGGVDRMKYPGDPNGSGGNVINCRCSIGYRRINDNEINYNDIKLEEKQIINQNENQIEGEFKEVQSIEEAEQAIMDIYQNNTPWETDDVTISEDLSIDEINAHLKQLNNLTSEYELNPEFALEEIRVSLNTYSESLGFVNYSDEKITHINFGSKYGDIAERTGSRAVLVNGNIEGSLFSKIDPSNLNLSTLTHEFAHTIAWQSEKNEANNSKLFNFNTKVNSIYKEYKSFLKENQNNLSELNKNYLGAYANTHVDEFMAEAFTEYKLNSNPSKYAVTVGKLIDKFYKKK